MHRGRREAGFTLVELLVVLVVVGILTAVAAPVYLGARRSAVDRATESDVTNVGLLMQSYYVDHTQPLVYAQTAGERVVRLSAGDASWTTEVPVSPGSTVRSFSAPSSALWCVAMGNDGGSGTVFRYTTSGLGRGVC